MPTPFTHLAYAQTFQRDADLTDKHRALVRDHWGDFLFGSIAPDSQHLANLRRHETHFFQYGAPPIQPPVNALLTAHPDLAAHQINDAGRLVFMAGYVGHLAVDEMWWNEFFYPNFSGEATGDWREYLFLAHALLAIIDERDYRSLTDDIYPVLQKSAPKLDLPFIKASAVEAWRDIVAEQLPPKGKPQTLEILGNRLPQGIAPLVEFLHDSARVDHELWGYISRENLAQVEARMQDHMTTTIIDYLTAHEG